jgi:hypothetical protein
MANKDPSISENSNQALSLDDSDASLDAWLKDLEQHSSNYESPNAMNRPYVAGAIFGTFVACILGFTVPFVFSKSILPYMATPGSKINKALKHLSNEKKPGVFVDLGSGDGEAVYQAAKLGYKAVGIELNFTLWVLSSMRRLFFWSASERAKSQFVWSNFFDYDLKNAKTVMMFGVVPLMKPLSQKLAAECKSGTDILSYRFALPLAHDKETSDLMRATIIYDEQEMRIYRCR